MNIFSLFFDLGRVEALSNQVPGKKIPVSLHIATTHESNNSYKVSNCNRMSFFLTVLFSVIFQESSLWIQVLFEKCLEQNAELNVNVDVEIELEK